jgi:hypothetical protein
MILRGIHKTGDYQHRAERRFQRQVFHDVSSRCAILACLAGQTSGTQRKAHGICRNLPAALRSLC